MEIIRIPFRLAEAYARFASYLLDSVPTVYTKRNISAECDLFYLTSREGTRSYLSPLPPVYFYAVDALSRAGDNVAIAVFKKNSFFVHAKFMVSGFHRKFSDIGSTQESIVVYHRGCGRKREFFNSAENTNKLTFIVAVQGAAGYRKILVFRIHNDLLYILAAIKSSKHTETLQACREVYLFNPRTGKEARVYVFNPIRHSHFFQRRTSVKQIRGFKILLSFLNHHSMQLCTTIKPCM